MGFIFFKFAFYMFRSKSQFLKNKNLVIAQPSVKHRREGAQRWADALGRAGCVGRVGGLACLKATPVILAQKEPLHRAGAPEDRAHPMCHRVPDIYTTGTCRCLINIP